ncbi:MAG: hypothetical protein WCN95_12620 [bacterium]
MAPITIRTLAAATVAITAGLIGISASISGCSDTDGPEKYIAVHIPDADQTVHADGSTWIYPRCVDTNVAASLYDATPSAYLLNVSDCVYAAHNHQPYMSPDGIPVGGSPDTGTVTDGGSSDGVSNTDVIAALPPVIVGNYSVTIYDKSDPGRRASGIPLTISSQTGESFVGSATVTLSDGTSESGSITGTCKANGDIRFRITTTLESGTYSGTFLGTAVGNPVQQMSGTAVYLIYAAVWQATRLNGATPP